MTFPSEMAVLMDCLHQIPPLELKAMTLLREVRLTANTGSLFPTVPVECVVAATQELVQYTTACAALQRKLAEQLAPVILPTLEIPEWPL